jgi:hypothetical protein
MYVPFFPMLHHLGETVGWMEVWTEILLSVMYIGLLK